MINRDAWLKAIDDAKRTPPPESDAITSTEYAALVRINSSTARHQLKKLVALGKATLTKKWVARTAGGFYPAPAYRLVEAPMRTTDVRDAEEDTLAHDGKAEPDDVDVRAQRLRENPRARARTVPKVPRRKSRAQSVRVARRR